MILFFFFFDSELFLCVGLTMEELEKLAKLGPRAQKTARRDIAHVVSK